MLVSMVLLSAITAGMVACSKTRNEESPRTRQERIATNFTSIELRTNADIYYRQGGLTSIEVEAPQYMIEQVETIIASGRLTIQCKNGYNYSNHESIRVYITAPDVSSFAISSSGSIFFLNAVHKEVLTLYSNGSGDIAMKDVTVRNLEVYATGAGSIKAETGNTVSETVKTSGSGDINLSAITAQTVTASNFAAGTIQVKATVYLKAKIEGSGSIFYKGYPDLSTQISGSGQLVHY